MPLPFSPQKLEGKEHGRAYLAGKAELQLNEVRRYFTTASTSNFTASYNQFVNSYPTAAQIIDLHRPDGVGPGELLAWFLFDNIHLGGKNLGIDLLDNGHPFAEIKGGVYSKPTHSLYDFKLSKDSDLAVSLLLLDLDSFNKQHRKIVGTDLPGWAAGQVGQTVLSAWEGIDLLELSKSSAPNLIYIPFDKAGNMLSMDEKRIIAHLDDPSIGKCIKNALLEATAAIDKEIATIRQIINRWKNQAFNDYVDGKTFILIDTKTLKALHCGFLTKEMIDLYRVTRNQPKVRIYLPREES